MKKIILLTLVMVQFGCSSIAKEEAVNYRTLVNCEPITANEDYINIDCKKRSVDNLTAEVQWINEPALVSLQAESLIISGLEICSNLTKEDIVFINKELDLRNKEIRDLYDFIQNPESKKDIFLVKEKLKGKYASQINEEKCKSLKEVAKQRQTFSEEQT